MAGVAPKTGAGTTLTFATSTFTASITSIGSFSESRSVINDSTLAQAAGTYEQYIPGDLISLEPFTVECYWDAQSSKMPPVTAAAELITITFPFGAGQSTTHSSISGTGFITSRTSPQIANNQRLTGSFQIQFDGKTGPTFTAGS